MPVYIDTSAWIALHEPGDSNHRKATAALAALLRRKRTLVSGLHTAVEFGDGLTRHYGQEPAAAAIEKILQSPSVRWLPSEPHFEAARKIFSSRGSWGVDLSDCLSFALMEARGVEAAFTFDSDFQKGGFEIVG